MRMMSGAILVLASAVSAAGYEIAHAVNVNQGGPLSFLAWVLGVAGLALMAMGWYEQDHMHDQNEDKPEKKK